MKEQVIPENVQASLTPSCLGNENDHACTDKTLIALRHSTTTTNSLRSYPHTATQDSSCPQLPSTLQTLCKLYSGSIHAIAHLSVSKLRVCCAAGVSFCSHSSADAAHCHAPPAERRAKSDRPRPLPQEGRLLLPELHRVCGEGLPRKVPGGPPQHHPLCHLEPSHQVQDLLEGNARKGRVKLIRHFVLFISALIF